MYVLYSVYQSLNLVFHSETGHVENGTLEEVSYSQQIMTSCSISNEKTDIFCYGRF